MSLGILYKKVMSNCLFADGTEVGAEMICQKCGDGFYQPNDNSTDPCRMYTNCITTPGTDVSDNVCKGDPQSSGLPATSPNENAASVLLTKASIGMF